jgi:Fe-S cluster biogenesis protein NfuA
MSMVETNTTIPLRERVEQALRMCRPFLQKDGGDIELAGIVDGRIVEVRFLGTCVGCPMSRMTLRAGLERTILRCVTEIQRVEAVK